MTYTAEGYKGATEEYLKPVTVEANGTAYINTYLESESYVPPTVVYENYPDEIGDNKAYGGADKYNVAAVGEETSPLATQLEGKTVRRQIIRNGHLFVLALDAANEPFIYDVNLADNSVAEISTEGTTLEENRQLKISDIAFTADNVLVATSYGENQFDNNQVASGDVRGCGNLQMDKERRRTSDRRSCALVHFPELRQLLQRIDRTHNRCFRHKRRGIDCRYRTD